MFYYTKVRDVKSPIRAFGGNAGIDFFIPNDLKNIIIKPNNSVNIPSGIHVKLNPNTALIFFNKSGIAVKKSLILGSCIVDESYQGEIYFNLHNVGNKIITISPNEKIIQGVILNIIYSDPCFVSSLDDLYNYKTLRGEGREGSTNNYIYIDNIGGVA